MSDSNWGGNDRRPAMNIACWLLNGITTVAVVLRIISRSAFGSASLGLDDVITVVCMLIVYAATIAMTLGTEVGFGQHLVDIDPANLGEAIKRLVIMAFFVVWAFSMPKFAIIALLRRLLRLGKWEERIIWGTAIVNQIGIFTLSVYWVARCHPPAKQWDPSLDGSCDDPQILGALGYAFSVTSAVLDIFFAVYPIRPIMRLQMCRKKRIAICCTLSIGCLACALSIYKISTFPTVLRELPQDPTWASVPLMIFSILEADILILTACLATFGPLLRWLLQRHPFGQRSSSKLTSNPGETWHAARGYKLRDYPRNSAAASARGDSAPAVPPKLPTKIRSHSHGPSMSGSQGSTQASVHNQAACLAAARSQPSAGTSVPSQSACLAQARNHGGIQKSVHISVTYE